MAVVVLPRSLVALVPGSAREADVEAKTVRDALERLDARWPGLLDRVCEPGPVLRRHLNVFVDGVQGDLSSPVRAGSTIHLIPAVSGGR